MKKDKFGVMAKVRTQAVLYQEEDYLEIVAPLIVLDKRGLSRNKPRHMLHHRLQFLLSVRRARQHIHRRRKQRDAVIVEVDFVILCISDAFVIDFEPGYLF